MTKPNQIKKIISVAMAMLMVITMLPEGIIKAEAAEDDKTTLYIDDGAISISGDTAKYNSGINTVTNANGFIIAQHDSTSPTFWSITVTGGNTDITLRNVNISEKRFDFGCAFTIAPGASVNLTLSGKNILESSSLSPGICVPSGAELSINGTGSDSLTAISGGNAAGIGGGNRKAIQNVDDSDCGKVNICGGTVTAIGKYGGAGIGGGLSGIGGTVNICGGTVTATGSEGAAGIGAGTDNGRSGITTITGGSVHAIDCNGNNSIQGDVKDSSGNIEHCVSVDAGTLIGTSKTLSASVQNGSFSQMQTDGSGKLYFWMNKNATDSATVQYGSDYYRLSVPVGTADKSITLSKECQMTVLDLSQESIDIGASSITAKDINNQPAGLNPNGYVIMQSVGGSTANMISVNDGTQNILLKNVNVSTTRSTSFYIGKNASVKLSLYGTNTLRSGSFVAFMVPSGASLTITDGDSLSVYSGRSYMGIGGLENECGTICINGGTINAYGGDYGAGIGNSVTINGGNVTAVGNSGSAGIGSKWNASCGTVVINGGNVTAISNGGGAGIGGGYEGGYGGTVIINGGNVSATGDVGAGIGGGGEGGCGGSLTITGGNIRAVGNRGGAGIGGGQGIVRTYGNGDNGGSGGNVTISGGTVTAIGSGGGADIGGGGPGGRGGSCGSAAKTTITGGSVCSSIQDTPTNGTDLVYRTTVSIPSGETASNLSIAQSGSKYTYGYKDMRTDNSTYGKLCLWLPANGQSQKTTADVVCDGGSYSGYYGFVGTDNNSMLKMDQRTLTIGGITDGGQYIYGSLPNAAVSGGSGTGSITYSYMGTDYSSSSKPCNVGAYSVTAKKAEDACYYALSAIVAFTIGLKELTDSDITVSIPVQEYTGSALTPDIAVTYNGIALTKDSDYSVSFTNNTDIADSSDSNPPTATITFKGNYTGGASKTFTIEAAPTISISHVPDNLDNWSAKVDFSVTATTGSSGIKSVTVKKDTNTTPTDITNSLNNGKYSFTAAESGSYTFTVTSNSGFTASQTVQASEIDIAAPVVGNISGNPETPVQSATLNVTAVPGASGIGSVTVSRYSNGQWKVLTGASVADTTEGNGSHTYTCTTTENGTYIFTITSVAGISADSGSVDVTMIDTVKPVVAIDSNGYTDSTWVNQNVILNIYNTSSNLGTTIFEYSTDGGKTWTAFDGSLTDSTEDVKNYFFRATSASGVISQVQSITVKIDKTVPVSPQITIAKNNFTTFLNTITFGLFFKDTVDVDIMAVDNNSGIASIKYQKVADQSEYDPNGTWKDFNSKFSISPDEKFIIYAKITDNAGNSVIINSNGVIVDKTSPDLTLSAFSCWQTGDLLSVGVTADDNLAGVQSVSYSTDEKTPQFGTVSLTNGIGTIVLKNEGDYILTVTASDNAGNTISQVTHIQWDKTSPTVTVSGNPSRPMQCATLHIEAATGVSGIRSVTVSGPQGDKDITNTYKEGYAVAQNGTYTFNVINNAGKSLSSVPAIVTNIDKVKPVVEIDSNGYTGDTWTMQNVKLDVSNLSANLGTTIYEYSTDGGKTWTAFDGSIKDEDEAATTYQFRATSASGVVSEIKSINVKIDKTAPVDMTIAFKQDPVKTVLHFLTFGIFFDDTVDVNLSATDKGSGIEHYEYQLVTEGGAPGTSWKTGTLSISPEFKGTLYARAIDKAGNYSGIVTKSLIVDKTEPTITLPQTTIMTTSPSATIPVAVKDNGAGVGVVTYQINAGSVQTIDATEGVTDYMDKYSFSIDCLPDGIYDVVINAQDNSGNSANSVTVHMNKDTSPKVFDVQVTPGSVSADHGAVKTFAATVTGINNPPTDVTWSVSGNRSIGTTIDANGRLTIADDESSLALTITATSVYDKTKSGKVIVKVNTADQTGFSFASSSITKKHGDVPITVNACGGQGYGSVSYKVTNGADVISINGNIVTVKKAGSAVITATKAADGSFRQATAAITLYIGKETPDVLTLPEASQINVVGRLSTCKLTGGSANIPGTFTWEKKDTIVTKTGNYEATFIPYDTTNYNFCTCMVKVTVNPIIYNSFSDIAFNLTGVTLPAEVTSVSVGSCVEPKSNNGSVYSLVENQIGSEEELNNLMIYNLKLLDQGDNPIETFTGKIKVRIPIPEGMSGELHVYWYNDANRMVTDMNARQENGYLVFDTTHFSYYAVAAISAKASSGSGKAPNPKTGSDPLQFVPAWLGVSGFILTVVTRKRRLRKKI